LNLPVRPSLRLAVAATLLTFWIDGLLRISGDAGPVGGSLDLAAPRLFLLPDGTAALVA